ncbi:MAG: Hsp20/alpha crystallin family protein [Myxococcota bacterium]
MALGDIIRRGEEIGVEPFRRMRELLGWDPFREMLQVWPERERLVTFTPSFDVTETKEAYVFKADVPGVKEEDLEITLTGNRLSVSGKRELEKKEEGQRYYSYERAHGSFERTFTLPEGVDPDNIHCELKDGVLTIALPKKPEVQPKRIALKAGGKAKA